MLPGTCLPFSRASYLGLGAFFQGGYYVGNIQIGTAMYGCLVAPISTISGGLIWKTTRSYVANSLVDGLANTNAMTSTTYPASRYCYNLVSGGYSDWYLPSHDEIWLAWVNRNALPSEERYTTGDWWTSTDKDTITSWVLDVGSSSASRSGIDKYYQGGATVRSRAFRRFLIT